MGPAIPGGEEYAALVWAIIGAAFLATFVMSVIQERRR